MSVPEFKSYSSIENVKKLWCTVTQKIHGTNAQIYINPADHENLIMAGSRTRWLTPEDDNYGFAKWVHDNGVTLFEKLGPGRHYGEWCGKGINNGEGLSTKMFVLFDWWNYASSIDPGAYPYLMEGVRVVPVLYKGHYSDAKIEEVMQELKATGSHLTPPGWWMKPEGIVIDINGTKYKRVFEQEDTAWKQVAKAKVPVTIVDVSHLLQPIRLEKIISRDEQYKRNYPDSLKYIVLAYVDDLEKDQQFDTNDKDLRKSLGRQIFPFVKHFMETAA